MSAALAALAIHAWAEAGLEASFASQEALDEAAWGATVELARLQARYEDPHHFGAHVQVEAASGTVQLLDASVRGGAKEGTWVAAGRMKVPVGLEYQVPAPKMVMPTRPLLTDMAGKRAVGVAVGHTLAERLQLRVGVYDPVGDVPQAGVGTDLVGALDLELPGHLVVHLAGGRWLHPADVAGTLGEEAPEWEGRVDLGVEKQDHGWTLLAEGVLAQRLVGEDWDLGLATVAGKRLPLRAEGFELEPALAADAVWAHLGAEERETVLRGGAALNLHRDDWHLVESLSWETQAHLAPSTEGPELEHVARLLLQAGF